ncbi:MAG: MipA/OmpV family protein [Arenicella sp.]
MKPLKIMSVALSSLSFCSFQANAQDPLQLNPESLWYKLGSETGWYFDLELGVEVEPTYAGSKNTETEPSLGARAMYRSNAGHRYFLTFGELGAIYSISPNTQFLAFLESEEGRDPSDDPVLNGLDKVDSTIEGQFTLARRFGNSTLFATLQPDLTGDANKGLVWFVGGTYDWLSKGGQWRFASRLDISGADTEYMATEFGITQSESQRTGYRSYAPSSGLKSATLGFSAEYKFSERLSVLSTLELENYLGDAKDSPLISDFGQSNTIEARTVLRWHF